MLEIIKEENKTPETIIKMKDMKPLQVGIIINSIKFKDHYVMRTASINQYEIMDLTAPKEQGCWTKEHNQTIRLLNPGEGITIKLFNK